MPRQAPEICIPLRFHLIVYGWAVNQSKGCPGDLILFFFEIQGCLVMLEVFCSPTKASAPLFSVV